MEKVLTDNGFDFIEKCFCEGRRQEHYINGDYKITYYIVSKSFMLMKNNRKVIRRERNENELINTLKEFKII